MPELFFASDLHFGHEKIVNGFGNKSEHADSGGRPFSSIQEHDEQIIANWNSVIGEKDVVWCLGDVILASDDFTKIGRLNGKIKLILGNHDTPAKIEKYREYFSRISAFETLGQSIILSHVPVHPCELESRFKFNIHGHRHADTLPDSRYLNVSMEAINYTPISFDEIKLIFKNRGIQ